MTFKVGDKVTSKDFGDGIVSDVISEVGESHPVLVKFTGSNLTYRFKLDGQYWLATPDKDADIRLRG